LLGGFFNLGKDDCHKVRVDSLFNNTNEFNIQFANGATDQFVFNADDDESKKRELWKRDISRMKAIKQFEII
jgi:hypothetical protein